MELEVSDSLGGGSAAIPAGESNICQVAAKHTANRPKGVVGGIGKRGLQVSHDDRHDTRAPIQVNQNVIGSSHINIRAGCLIVANGGIGRESDTNGFVISVILDDLEGQAIARDSNSITQIATAATQGRRIGGLQNKGRAVRTAAV